MATIFLSHSSANKPFVRKLGNSLTALGHNVWLDEWKIRVGDSIVEKVSEGIEKADFVVVVLSSTSVASRWVEREWQAKYWDEINRRRVHILPVLLDSCRIPQLLRDKKYADFRTNYEKALFDLAESLIPRQDLGQIEKYYADFIDIGDEWVSFLEQATHLDLLMMYSETWRNTYLKYLRRTLERPGGRIRVVLPAFDRSKPLVQLYSQRLNVSGEWLQNRHETAIKDFRGLGRIGQVEIFTTNHYFNHACYLSDAGGILALYSFQDERTPTPAFVVGDGTLLDFLREDFEWMVSRKNSYHRLLFRSDGPTKAKSR